VAFSEGELARLAGFRRAARQVREASIIAEGRDLTVHFAAGDPGYVNVFVRLLGDEPFRSMALAVRLAYQEGEPAHFFSICGILGREGTPEQRVAIDELRAQWAAALRDPAAQVISHAGPAPRLFDAKEVFETWLYGVAFHQDLARQADVGLLAAEGAFFHWSVQSTSLQLAGRILDLDDTIAWRLGETPLPRIRPPMVGPAT
jgi:hypothetical protein